MAYDATFGGLVLIALTQPTGSLRVLYSIVYIDTFNIKLDLCVGYAVVVVKNHTGYTCMAFLQVCYFLKAFVWFKT